MSVRRHPHVGSWRGSPEHSLSVRVLCARRRICFTAQALSTSPWLRGTLARSPACWCAAVHLGSAGGLGWLAKGCPLPHCGGSPGRGPLSPEHSLSVRVLCARRRICSTLRAPSTSPWKRGTLARSTACECAATHTSGAGGVGVAGRGAAALCHRSTHSACACYVRGAGYVPCRGFQPARGCMGRWQGHQHECAPRPRREPEGLGWFPRALPFATGAPTWRARAAAQRMFMSASAFNQPVEAWDVGKVTNMDVRRRARVGSRRGWDGCGRRGGFF